MSVLIKPNANCMIPCKYLSADHEHCIYVHCENLKEVILTSDKEVDTEKGINRMSKEMVNHPDHYNKKDRKECWDEMGEAFGDTSVVIFDILSAYKYYYRMGRKEDNPEEQDKAKARSYLEHAKDLILILASSKQDVSQLAEMLLEMEDYLDGEN